MQYDNLKKKAIELLIGNTWPYGFTGQMPEELKQLFVDMADEICCLKARIDELEKKAARAHFGEMKDDGETES